MDTAGKNLILKDTDRIGIVNRGEAALRFIRAVTEYNDLHNIDLKTVALFVDKEENAPFVKAADDLIRLSGLPGYPGKQQSPYLDHDLIFEALKEGNCNAVWVGWGFVSEDAEFAEKIESAGIVFLGPTSHAMKLLGDKIKAKELAEKSDVPILPWSRGAVKTYDEAKKISEELGYPVIVKAANAGGGRGIRFVWTKEELEKQYTAAKEETIRITGNDIIFIELLVVKGRHLEVQILADKHGNINTFGVRDCSVQRKNQKIIEETPPPNFPVEIISEMEASAARLIKTAGYTSAGTVEYLYDLERDAYYFMEVNTRLQVEHPITENLFQIDLVQGQIDTARGKEIILKNRIPRGAVIEVRLNAEDPDKDFNPSPGEVTLFKPPAGAGIRVDSGIEQGSEIPSEFDSMVAKIIASAPTRKEAISKLKRALNELKIRIFNGTTNKAFLLHLLSLDEINSGEGVHTGFVEKHLKERKGKPDLARTEIALLAGAIDLYYRQYKADFYNFKQQLSRLGRPRNLPANTGYEINITAYGNSYTILVKALGENHYQLQINNTAVTCKYQFTNHEGTLFYNNSRYNIIIIPRGDSLQCEIDGFPVVLESDSGGWVKSPSPAIVLSINSKLNQKVKKGDVLITLEAMKMEMLVEAPSDGIVKEISVITGEQVSAGSSLIQMEAGEQTSDNKSGDTPIISFTSPAVDGDYYWQSLKRELYAIFLGYDNRVAKLKLLKEISVFLKNNGEYKTQLIEAYIKALEIFSIIENLFLSTEIETTGFSRPVTNQELLTHYFRRDQKREKGLPEIFLDNLHSAIDCYSVSGLSEDQKLDHAIFHIFKSHADIQGKQELVKQILFRLGKMEIKKQVFQPLSNAVDNILKVSQSTAPSVADAAMHLSYQVIEKYKLQEKQNRQNTIINNLIAKLLEKENEGKIPEKLVQAIIDSSGTIVSKLINAAVYKENKKKMSALEVLGRRFNRDRTIYSGNIVKSDNTNFFYIQGVNKEENYSSITAVIQADRFNKSLDISSWIDSCSAESPEIIILLQNSSSIEETENILKELPIKPVNGIKFLSIGILAEHETPIYRTYKSGKTWTELSLRRGFSPLEYRELRIYRLSGFNTNIIYKSENVTLLDIISKENPKDQRLFAFASVSIVEPVMSEGNDIRKMAEFEAALMESIYAMRAVQARYKYRLQWNRIIIHNRSLLGLHLMQLRDYGLKLAEKAKDLGLERYVIYSRRKRWREDVIRELELLFINVSQDRFSIRSRKPSTTPLEVLDDYTSRVVRARQRGDVYPYEFIKMITKAGMPLTEEIPGGEFEEFDVSENKPVSVKDRLFGKNSSNIVFGIISTFNETLNIHFKRVLILADPTKDLGSLAEPECRNVIAALDLAEREQLPVEWVAISSGAKITMESGTENLDWTAAALKKIVNFTQNGGEINIIVPGINVGAQSYWNAEATMLMHTRGLLIMTENASILLTGKKALDFSGSVSGKSNIDIGGIEKIMGPNGQAQIRVPNLASAYNLLLKHYFYTYVKKGDTYPVKNESSDPIDRDISVTSYTDYLDQGFSTIGDIFSQEKNPERKKPFDIRQVMHSIIDSDSSSFERWQSMKNADTAVIWETRIGGYAVGMIGIESRNIHRIGAIPADGPESWSGGTLFPLSSKKVARGINAFSGHLPLVITANLSGFDGSPESLRNLQLEYGAEIGRGIVNFKGPIIFIVIARYHGGAYVVFSKSLNPNITSAALEGSYASVIGGAPAAAVVFPKTVSKEANTDIRVINIQRALRKGKCTPKEYKDLFQKVYNEKQTELGLKFDQIHSVERAKEVNSIDDIISVKEMRPYIINKLKKDFS